MESNNKSQDIMGQINQQPYPININININNSKKEGDIFQRNSANISAKGLGKRIYNINKGILFLDIESISFQIIK